MARSWRINTISFTRKSILRREQGSCARHATLKTMKAFASAKCVGKRYREQTILRAQIRRWTLTKQRFESDFTSLELLGSKKYYV